MESTNNGSEGLMRDFSTVVGDTDELIKVTAGDTQEGVTGLRTRAKESLQKARTHIGDMQKDVAARARSAARTTHTYVHENPWQSIGLAAAAGLVLGLLINRRR